MKVGYAGRVAAARLDKILARLGGERADALNSTVTCVVATAAEVKKGSARIAEADRYALPVCRAISMRIPIPSVRF
jgi:hypothetical protein